MNLLEKFTSIFPFGEKKISPEYYFALNISSEKLTAALWKIEGNNLQIIETAADAYSSLQDILRVTDSLLDKVLGIRETEPEKILFGVPDSWLIDDDLRGEYLKVLRNMVKDLELTPMAYVATSHALIHLLEKQEGVPTTAILVGLESEHLVVSVVRAGRLDGTKVVERSSEGGVDIEKALLTFANVETLPSKILLYGMDKEKLEKIKNELHSFAWMQNLSFLHFPKIEALNEDIEIESICFAGGFELNSSATYVKNHGMHSSVKQMGEVTEITRDEKEHKSTEKNEKLVSTSRVVPQEEGSKNASLKLGFMVGDISQTAEKENTKFYEQSDNSTNENLMMPSERSLIEQEDIAQDTLEQKNTSILEKSNPLQSVKSFFINNFLGKSWSKGLLIVAIFVLLSGIIIVGYLMISKAEVRIFVEPQILEKETTVTSDPKQKEIDREAKVIPGQIVETEVSGSDSMQATGSREIGDSAKGIVIIRKHFRKELYFQPQAG
jgi:hypothetical protein